MLRCTIGSILIVLGHCATALTQVNTSDPTSTPTSGAAPAQTGTLAATDPVSLNATERADLATALGTYVRNRLDLTNAEEIAKASKFLQIALVLDPRNRTAFVAKSLLKEQRVPPPVADVQIDAAGMVKQLTDTADKLQATNVGADKKLATYLYALVLEINPADEGAIFQLGMNVNEGITLRWEDPGNQVTDQVVAGRPSTAAAGAVDQAITQVISQSTIHRFLGEGARLFSIGDTTIPDQLQVATIENGFRIHGPHAHAPIRFEGGRVGHIGKAVCLPLRAGEGTLTSREPSKHDHIAYHLIVMRRDKPERREIRLNNDEYQWKVEDQPNEVLVTVKRGSEIIETISAPKDAFTGIGFASTVRRPGDRSDLTIRLSTVNQIHAPIAVQTATKPPVESDKIEKPEFANKVKPVVRLQSSVRGMLTSSREDGHLVGYASDIIATTSPDARRGDLAGFNKRVGPAMQTSFDEAIRAVRLRYPQWDRHIEISFAEKYTEKDGGSAGAAFGLLMLSMLEDVELDPDCAVTGDITVDWKIRAVGAVSAKLRGAALDGCSLAVIPAESEAVVSDLGLLYGESSVWKIQILSMGTLQECLGVVRKDREASLAEAINVFGNVRATLDKTGRVGLAKAETRAALEQVIQLAPNHLSAKYLLQLADNQAPKSLSVSASLYEFFAAAYPYRNYLFATKIPRQGDLPDTTVVATRNRIRILRRIGHKDLQPTLTRFLDFVDACEAIIAKPANRSTLDETRRTLLASFDEISASRELMEKLVREGY